MQWELPDVVLDDVGDARSSARSHLLRMYDRKREAHARVTKARRSMYVGEEAENCGSESFYSLPGQ